MTGLLSRALPEFRLTVKVTVWPTGGFMGEALIVVVVVVAATTVVVAAREVNTEIVIIRAIIMAVDFKRVFMSSYPLLTVYATVVRL